MCRNEWKQVIYSCPEELNALIKQMAKIVHEVWAQTRVVQDWCYGVDRNDAEKLHSMLVLYDELPKEDKVYDRNTLQATLKSILNLGFKIV